MNSTNARAIALLERLDSLPDTQLADLRQLSTHHRFRADYLMLRGETGLARKELERDLYVIRSVPPAETASRELVLSEALALAWLGRWSGEFPPLRSPTQYQRVNAKISDLESRLAELTAARLGFLPSIDRSPCLIPQDLSAEAWSDRVISCIRSDAAKFGLDHTRIPSIGWRMKPWFSDTLWLQRQAGNLGRGTTYRGPITRTGRALDAIVSRSSRHLSASERSLCAAGENRLPRGR